MENETLRTHQNFRENKSGPSLIETVYDKNVPGYDQEVVVALRDRTLLFHVVLGHKGIRLQTAHLTIPAINNPRLNYSNFFSIISFLDTFLLMLFRLYTYPLIP